MVEKTSYKKDLKDGPSEIFSDDGILRSRSNFKNDLQTGFFERFFPNGQTMYSYTYFKGKKNGGFLSFDKDGNQLQRGFFKNDLMHGSFGPDNGEWECYEENIRQAVMTDFCAQMILEEQP